MNTKKYKFHNLTPTTDVELGIYADALDYAFSDDDLENIAITGPYSSGKSSMLETYKAANKDKTFIHISLAHFEADANHQTELENKDKNDDESEKKADQNKSNYQQCEADIKSVEGKILNQLIHQIDTKEIPQTHFKIKRRFYPEKTFAISAILTVFFVLLIFLFNRNTWIVFANGITQNWLEKLLKPTITEWFAVACIVVSGFLFLWGLYSILEIQHNKNLFRKLSFRGNEIEIFEKDDGSFFDKHLNEVIYLFKNTEADAIVFEDMDRYNANQIFEKLREINYLLNNSINNTLVEKSKLSRLATRIKCKILKKEEEETCDKVFKFFYLLRDDIFTSKDRTKFFDFIIPIVPVISGSNSYDKFIEYFKEGGMLGRFKGEFLQEIAMYIDDMRLLKNIYNEYQVYHERIQSTELSNDKLLGMIAYKNLFPRDFSELQLGKGYVFCLFRNKEQYIKDEIKSIEDSSVAIHQIITKAGQEQLKDEDELDALFLRGKKCIYDVEGKEVSDFPTHSDFIRAMKEKPDKVYSASSYYGRNHDRKITNIMAEFEKIHAIPEYKERIEIIEAKTAQKRKDLDNELKQLETQKRKIQGATLSEIVETSREMASKVFSSTYIDEINTVYEYQDVKESLYFPLIKYLIRNKKIDENYADYMSYFYEESMVRQDQIFVRSVFDVEAKPMRYSLKNPALVADKISLRYYSQEEVLNFDLFDFLLESNNKNLTTFLKQLRMNNRVDFIIEFWQTGKQNPLLFQNINKAWPGIWDEILKKESVDEETKNKYLIDTFYYSPYSDIRKMNFQNEITDYISSCPDFLAILEPKVSLISDALERLEVHFTKINYNVSNKELFNKVYSRNLYRVNKSMVFLILEKVYQITESEDFYHKNYSLLMAAPEEPVAQYINNRMDYYLGMIINICNEKITDDEKWAIALLNHEGGEEKDKKTYIKFLTTTIKELVFIDNLKFWPLLVSYNRVPCSGTNIIHYYFKIGNGFDEILTDFINVSELEGTLEYDYIMEKHGEGQADKFYENIITNNRLENKQYTTLLGSFKWKYLRFELTNIDKNKMEILIDLEIIEMNPANLDFIRENYSACKEPFIIKNIDEYAQNTIDKDLFDLSEAEYLLEQKVSDKNVLNILSFTDEPISINQIEVSDEVKKHIIENNYCENDLESLVVNYEKETQGIKERLLSLFVKEIAEIIENDIKVPYSLLIGLLESPEVSSKRELLANQIKDLTLEQAIECLEIEKIDDLLIVFEGKWPSVQIDDINTSILETMENKGWLSSYVENQGKSGYYEVRAKRRIKKDEGLPENLL